jgi:hypothetical protein
MMVTASVLTLDRLFTGACVVSIHQMPPALFQGPGFQEFLQGSFQAPEIGFKQALSPGPDPRPVKINQVHAAIAADEDIARIQIRVNQPMIMESPDTSTRGNPHRWIVQLNGRQISQGVNIQQSPGHQVPGVKQAFLYALGGQGPWNRQAPLIEPGQHMEFRYWARTLKSGIQVAVTT